MRSIGSELELKLYSSKVSLADTSQSQTWKLAPVIDLSQLFLDYVTFFSGLYVVSIDVGLEFFGSFHDPDNRVSILTRDDVASPENVTLWWMLAKCDHPRPQRITWADSNSVCHPFPRPSRS